MNVALAVPLCALFMAVTVGLGSELYRCEVQIPNCD